MRDNWNILMPNTSLRIYMYVNGSDRTLKTKTPEMLGTDIYLNTDILGYGANHKNMQFVNRCLK